VHTEGAVKLLSHPEFSDVGKAKGILELLNREDLMVDLIKECSSSDGLAIRIGSENKIEGLNECSVVTATYSVNGVNLGSIGVLGPTRMDYPRVIAALEYVRKRLTGANKLPENAGAAVNELPPGNIEVHNDGVLSKE
jgi:heat-inducible transcriptional repressor